MNQIPLDLKKKLTYDPAKFSWHNGVQAIKDYLDQVLMRKLFSVAHIYGKKRSGKSHLAIKIYDLLLNSDFDPHLLISSEELKDYLLNISVSNKDAIIIDQADAYFLELSSETSGAFVSFYEEIKKAGAKLIILSELKPEELNIDSHLLSRFAAMTQLNIAIHGLEDHQQIIELLALQRGLKFTDKNITYLSTRLARDIEAIESYFERLLYSADFTDSNINMSLLAKAL